MSVELVAEFPSAEAALEGVRRLREMGYRDLEVCSPYPVEGLDAVLPRKKSPLPALVLVAGVLGAVTAYAIIYFTTVVDYPIDVGGRPHHAIPAFVPITFETAVLFAGTTAFVASLLIGRMPRLRHPRFDVPGFERASIDRYFVCLTLDDEASRATALEALEAAEPVRVTCVRPDGEPVTQPEVSS